MMLSEFLSRPPVFDLPPLRPPERLREICERIELRWPDDASEPDEASEASTLKRVLHRVTTGNWRKTRPSLVRSAVRLVFRVDLRARRDLDPVRVFLIEEARAVRRRTGFLKAVADAYLASFERGAPHSRELAAVLQAVLERMPRRARRRFEAFPELLDPEAGPSRLGERMAGTPTPYRMLREGGIRSPHSEGFMLEAHAEYLAVMQPFLETGEIQAAEAVFGWLSPSRAETLEHGALETARALLGPWRERTPPQSYRTLLTNRLVELYGDPRFAKNTWWHGVEETDLRVIRGWLVGATLTALFDIVSESEKGDRGHERMWRERRAFWEDMYRKGVIDEAWVAFSPRAAAIAKRQAQAAPDAGLRSFAEQTAGGSRSNTSIVIMRCGGRTVVEGSHNYKVHVFQRNFQSPPELYRRQYDCEDIRLSLPDRAEFKRAHISGWQQWVKERLL